LRLPRLSLPQVSMPRFSLPRIDWSSPLLQHRLRMALVALGGSGAAVLALGMVWPEKDRALEPKQELTPASLGEAPRRPITLRVIGSDADQINTASNGAAPAGRANADALILMRIAPNGPVQVLNLPVELAVMLPGTSAPQALGSLYREGGVALTADAVHQLLGLKKDQPDRYLVVPRGALRELVSGLGGLELDPPRKMHYQDKSQKLTIDLQGGLQQLGGKEVEQLARYRDQWLGESNRRSNQQLLETSLRERMAESEQLANLPNLLRSLQGKVDTNLSGAETLSLLAVGLDPNRPIRFKSLPLLAAKKEFGSLRQLRTPTPRPPWSEP
jgi:LCP family protein required for cell wall assembly